MLGKIKDRRRRGQQRMRWLDGINNSMTWVWVNSGSWWWTERPGVLQSMGLQRVRPDWAELIHSMSNARPYICPTFQNPRAYISYSRICQSFKPPMTVSFPRAPFCVLDWGLVCPNQYCSFRQLWCLFANNPYCFRQCYRPGAFPWSSKSAQLHCVSVHRAIKPQNCSGGNGSSSKLKYTDTACLT